MNIRFATFLTRLSVTYLVTIKALVSTCIILLLGGCTSLTDIEPYAADTDEAEQTLAADTQAAPLHTYAQQLAKQLFITANPIELNQSVAVGTFLPVNGKKGPFDKDLGKQLQESFNTLAMQAGLKVVEFKASQSIQFKNDNDVMLSREIEDINPQIAVNYYLTGTYSIQDTHIIVNARLIETESQQLIAAATDTIPVNALWDQNKVGFRNNRIVRNGY